MSKHLVPKIRKKKKRKLPCRESNPGRPGESRPCYLLHHKGFSISLNNQFNKCDSMIFLCDFPCGVTSCRVESCVVMCGDVWLWYHVCMSACTYFDIVLVQWDFAICVLILYTQMWMIKSFQKNDNTNKTTTTTTTPPSTTTTKYIQPNENFQPTTRQCVVCVHVRCDAMVQSTPLRWPQWCLKSPQHCEMKRRMNKIRIFFWHKFQTNVLSSLYQHHPNTSRFHILFAKHNTHPHALTRTNEPKR